MVLLGLSFFFFFFFLAGENPNTKRKRLAWGTRVHLAMVPHHRRGLSAQGSVLSRGMVRLFSVKFAIFSLGKGWAEWIEGKHRDDQWNLFWKTCRVPERYRLSARANQVINKVSSQNSITSKDQLAKNMRLMRARYGTAYGFTPMTWVLPRQMAEVETALKRAGNGKGGSKKAFICKPARLSRGRGIFLFKTASELRSKMTREDATLARQKAAKLRRRAEAKKGKKAPIGSAASAGSVGSVGIWVVQRYISRPCLLRGRKFDIRTYALVPSTWPLLALVYRRGFCRLGHSRHTPRPITTISSRTSQTLLSTRRMLPQLQKRAQAGARALLSIPQVRANLALKRSSKNCPSRGADADRVWSDMKESCLKLLRCSSESAPPAQTPSSCSGLISCSTTVSVPPDRGEHGTIFWA